MKSNVRCITRVIFAVVALCTFALPVSAATVGVGESYTLPETGSTSGNLYVAAGMTIVSGAVSGDSLIAAGDATLAGTVSDDVFVAGGSVELLGEIAGDARAAAGKLTVADRIGGDAVFAAGALSLLPVSSIAGDALIAGGKVSALGGIGGNAYVAAGDVFLDGHIGGNVRIYAARRVHLGSNAVIDGDLWYRSPQEFVRDPGAVVSGTIDYEFQAPVVSAKDARGFFAGLFGIAFIARFIILLATALFLVFVFRRMSANLVRVSRDEFWKTTLIGLVVLVVAPVACLIIAFTVLGLILSILTMLAWMAFVIVAQAYAGIAFAGIARSYVFKKELPPVVSLKEAVLGVLGLGIVALVPYIGFFVYLVFFLSALGSLSILAYRHFLLAR